MDPRTMATSSIAKTSTDMKKELWSLSMSREAFRSSISQIVHAENAGITLGRISFQNGNRIVTIGIEGTEPTQEEVEAQTGNGPTPL